MTVEPWLLPPRAPRGGRVALFCFTCADADAAMPQRLHQALHRTADVYDIRCDLHPDDGLPPVETLVRRLARQIAGAGGPPAIFLGHRAGALVALALVHQLRRIGACGPVKLILSSCRAPCCAPPGQGPLAIPITVLADQEDGLHSLQQIGAWCDATTGSCRVHWCDGDNPDGALLLAHIEAELQEAAAGAAAGAR